mgnify:CR=1 FL=1
MQLNMVKAIYNTVCGNGVTSIMYPVNSGTNTAVAGTVVTAGGTAYVFNPTVAAGFTALIATATETADYLVGCWYPDTWSALGVYFVRFGQAVAQSFGLEFRTRRRIQAGTGINSRLSASAASVAGGNETVNSHTAIIRGT